MFELDHMEITAENVVLVAKQHKIEELNQLASTADFVEVISNLIHSLQAERGSSCLYLASSGQKFTKTKEEIIHESRILATRLRDLLSQKLAQSTYANAKLLSLMAWVLLGLDDLAVLRQNIHAFKLTAHECIDAYSRLISGLIALIFDVADTAVDPRISNLLVALFNLVQGKEFAGQERALGCYAFGSGKISPQYKQRILHLIDNQSRHFEVFCEFAKPIYVEKWHKIEQSDSTKFLHQLRAQLNSTHTLDHHLSELWFNHCSERLTDIWVLQCDLIHRIKICSANLISEAEIDLENAQGLIAHLRENPPSNASLGDRFFDPSIPVEFAFDFVSSVEHDNHRNKTIIDVLQLQSKRLADMELELQSARNALTERKTIERAKGLLMSQFNLSEEVAYKRMRSTAMEQKKKMIDVAQTIISISHFKT
jgi:hypothetical protein